MSYIPILPQNQPHVTASVDNYLHRDRNRCIVVILTSLLLLIWAGVVFCAKVPIMLKERIAVYIDGGNLYRKLKNLGIPEESSRFNFSAFVEYLVGDRVLVSKRYYVGIVRNVDGSQKSENMVKGQQKFLNSLRDEGFEVKPGKIMYDEGLIREKGVDVKLSLDIAIGAVDNLYDTAIVISSDTDLVPVIKYVKNAKKKSVEYVGFGSNPSLGMIKESSVPRIFSKQDVSSFQTKTLKFKESLIELITSGQKTFTWRLFDEKQIKSGDVLIFKISETSKEFAQARAVTITEKKLCDISEMDYEKSGVSYQSLDERVGHYKKMYGENVSGENVVKIIQFELIEKYTK